MPKTIFIINQYASTPGTGLGGRHHHIAHELGKLGYRVYVVAARWHHLLHKKSKATNPADMEVRDYYTFVRIPTIHYAHARDPRRAFGWLRFMWTIRRLNRIIGVQPDTVLYSSPSLPAYLGAEWLARRQGARLIFEVRDIWPLTLIELGKLSHRHPFIRFLQWIEDRAYRNADAIVSTLPYAISHMTRHGMIPEKFSWIPNGISLDDVEHGEPLDPDVLEILPKGKFLIGYTGSIGLANALDVLVDAAILLRKQKDIVIVIVGQGADRERLAFRIAEQRLNNIIILDVINKSQIVSLLSRFEVCYIGLKQEPLFRFGVSPNKLFDYMLAQKPILYGIDSGAYRPIAELKAGYEFEPENAVELVASIKRLKDLPPQERLQMGIRAHAHVIEKHTYSHLAAKLAKLL